MIERTFVSTRKHLTWWAVGATTVTALAIGTTAAPTRAEAPTGATGAGGYLAPYYTAGDVTGDDEITKADLDVLVPAVGTGEGDDGWADVSPADYDEDGEITLADVAALSARILYDDGSFELVEASALDMQKAMNAGVVTSVELTQAYLDRIAAYDGLVDDEHARALNSIISTSDVALAAAAASDAARAQNGGPRSMLDGIPIVLKDNYNTADMPTTGGCGCWDDNQTADDAFMVEGLRDAGAIILAKATLDEFAFGFASEYSAFLPTGTSKLVASPYSLSRTAGGSSGGTGASISASLGAIGFGTDTGGSIRVPSSYNQLVGVRPTVGLTSRDGIIPLALSQDTGGPMARSVSDAAIALDAVVGVDPLDPVTSEQAAGDVPTSYTRFLDPTALKGRKVGYLASMRGTNPTTTRLFDQAIADLVAQGATVEAITIDGISPVLGEGSGSTNEMKHDLDGYIASYLSDDVAADSLSGIIDSGRFVPSRASTYTTRNSITPTQYADWMSTHTAAIANGETVLTGALDANGLDALIYPSTNPYSTLSTNLRLSPNTGMPSVTVPMGQGVEGESIPGAGVNLEFIGRNYSEGDLLGMAYAYEQATAHRTAPAAYPALAGDVFPALGSDETAEAGTGVVTIGAAPAELAIGEEFTVTVSQSAADLYAYGLTLGYDPTRIAYVDGSATTATTGSTYEETGEGTVSVTHTKLGTSPTSSGDTELVTLTFRALASGPATITGSALTTVDGSGGTTDVGSFGSATVEVDLDPAPQAVSAPSISGTPQVGHTLSAAPAVWDLDGVVTSRQWLAGGTPIAGATEATYRLRPGDVGQPISVVETATLDQHAAGKSTSAATAAVTPATTATTAKLRKKAVAKGRKARIAITVSADPTTGLVPAGAVRVVYGGEVVATQAALADGTATVAFKARLAKRLERGESVLRKVKVVYLPAPGYQASSTVLTLRVRR